jgi:hypothetical protein
MGRADMKALVYDVAMLVRVQPVDLPTATLAR